MIPELKALIAAIIAIVVVLAAGAVLPVTPPPIAYGGMFVIVWVLLFSAMTTR